MMSEKLKRAFVDMAWEWAEAKTPADRAALWAVLEALKEVMLEHDE